VQHLPPRASPHPHWTHWRKSRHGTYSGWRSASLVHALATTGRRSVPETPMCGRPRVLGWRYTASVGFVGSSGVLGRVVTAILPHQGATSVTRAGGGIASRRPSLRAAEGGPEGRLEYTNSLVCCHHLPLGRELGGCGLNPHGR
jgi:hypothetical protein